MIVVHLHSSLENYWDINLYVVKINKKKFITTLQPPRLPSLFFKILVLEVQTFDLSLIAFFVSIVLVVDFFPFP